MPAGANRSVASVIPGRIHDTLAGFDQLSEHRKTVGASDGRCHWGDRGEHGQNAQGIPRPLVTNRSGSHRTRGARRYHSEDGTATPSWRVRPMRVSAWI